ncbi:MAG: A/G-specific adenine glycosylase [Theionarchaea archaeon]|nr:A/G-specific adenine glycosylase [Theionarchaea archaeon]MBU7037186.1 A/G-specific adenine glycosylase [Theionarchaea archaeon]
MKEVSHDGRDRKFQASPLAPESIAAFRTLIYDYYSVCGRSFPWRETTNPYRILVSEFMLQQTQTQRVKAKYNQFIHAFPDIHALADAPFKDVLKVWQGLGYNRRALNLKKTAELVVTRFHGDLPSDVAILETLPGIGKATAGALAAFAFLKPAVFIETNIRTVYIHFFFSDREIVRDTEILPLVKVTLDRRNPREWYYALMDYGVMIKKSEKNPSRRSAHHQKQSPFEGSDRQIRGKILHILLDGPRSTGVLIRECGASQRVMRIIKQLEKEGLIKEIHDGYSLV